MISTLLVIGLVLIGLAIILAILYAGGIILAWALPILLIAIGVWLLYCVFYTVIHRKKDDD